jgi:hypothetical protein
MKQKDMYSALFYIEPSGKKALDLTSKKTGDSNQKIVKKAIVEYLSKFEYNQELLLARQQEQEVD